MKVFPRELYDHVREINLPKEQGRSSMQELLCMISTLKLEKMKLEIPPSKEINVPRARNLSSLVFLYIKSFSKFKIFYNVMCAIPYSNSLFLMKFLFVLPLVSNLNW